MLNGFQRICLTGFLLSFCVMSAGTALPFFIFDFLNGGAEMSGAFGAAQAAAYALGCIVSLRFLARAKNGLVFAMFGAMGFAVLFCLVPFSRYPTVCCAAATLANVTIAFAWPALHSWVGSEPNPRVRSRHMIWFNISWSSGFAVSPLLAGPLYDLDYRWPFAVTFALGFVIYFLLRSIPHESAYFGTATEEELSARAHHDRASEIYLYAAWCATFLSNVLVGVTRSIYPKRIDNLVASGELRMFFESIPAAFLQGAPATKYSWLAFALALATVACFPIMGLTTRWHHKFQLLFWIQVSAAVSIFFLSQTQSLAVMMACFAVIGANNAICFFSSAYYSLADPAHKHRRATLNETFVGAGGFAGSIVFGYLAGRYSILLPFRYTPIFIALIILIEIALIHHGHRRIERRERG